MANVRQFKKDIDFVVNELVVECFTYNYLFPDKNKDELALLISDVINTGQDLIKKVNGVKSSKENTAKSQYKVIRSEFNVKINEFVARLAKLENE